VPIKDVGRRFEMDSYYTMEQAAEVRAQQLLVEAEHRRLVLSIESARHHRALSSSIGAGVAATFHRLTGRIPGSHTSRPAVQGR
jgi:hypothetical protein